MQSHEPHNFQFSTRWRNHLRLCGTCHLTYDDGKHIEINKLKPYTNYVCPDTTGFGLGHSSHYTGAYRLDLRSVTDHICICGAEFVEEDNERWLLSWEMQNERGEWRTIENIGTHSATTSQQAGLETMPDIRNIRLVRLVEQGSSAVSE